MGPQLENSHLITEILETFRVICVQVFNCMHQIQWLPVYCSSLPNIYSFCCPINHFRGLLAGMRKVRSEHSLLSQNHPWLKQESLLPTTKVMLEFVVRISNGSRISDVKPIIPFLYVTTFLIRLMRLPVALAAIK